MPGGKYLPSYDSWVGFQNSTETSGTAHHYSRAWRCRWEFGWWDGKTWLYSKEPSQVWRLRKNVFFFFSESHSWTIDMVCFHGTCLLRISGSWTTNELNYVKQPSWLMLKWPHANWFSGLLYNLRISMGYNLIDMYITRQTVHNVHRSIYIYMYLIHVCIIYTCICIYIDNDRYCNVFSDALPLAVGGVSW